MSNYYYQRSYEDQKYHGLINQGATCYLNSVLQVLFMTKDFRKAVRRNAHGNHIDVQLASLFSNLMVETSETVEVTKKLGIHRVCEQRDAAEHFEKILTLSSDQAAKIFLGKLSHQTICSGCFTVSDDDADFWDLPLALVKSPGKSFSVKDGIQEFFKDSCFDGDNQMYCDICCAKCDATAKCVVKHHPEVLMLLLKRFEFSYHHMSFVKNGCDVDVPFSLQIPENQTYELYAFVEHFGSLQGGHYTATIMDDEGRWYCFNDSSVTLFNNQSFQRQKTFKTRTAYLLFYRKKYAEIQDNREGSKKRSPSLDKNIELCRDDNRRVGGKDAVKSKIHEKPSDLHVNKQENKTGKMDDEESEDMREVEAKNQTGKKETVSVKRKMEANEKEIEKKKGKTEAESLTSRTDTRSDKHDSFKGAKTKTSVSLKQDKQEQQRDRMSNDQGDNKQMTGVKKHPWDGAHNMQNKPYKPQDVHREGNTSHNKPHEGHQKQNYERKIDGDEGNSGGKEREIVRSPEKRNKTDSDRNSGQKKERQNKGTNEEAEAVRKATRKEKHLEKLQMGEFNSQKNSPVPNPSEYWGTEKDDEHSQIQVEPLSARAESGRTEKQEQGAGSVGESLLGNSEQTKKQGVMGRLRKWITGKDSSAKSKKGAKQRKDGAGAVFLQQHQGEGEVNENTTGCCFSFPLCKKKNKTKK